MKKTRKLLSIILCLALTLCLALPALATEGKYTLTINSETSGHTYEAYQIFAGDLAKIPNTETYTLVNIQWGSGLRSTGEDLMAEIRAISVSEPAEYPFASCESADDVATKLAENAALVDAFAEAVGKFLKDDPTGTGSTGAATPEGKYVATISDLPAGYYLVQDDTDVTIGAGSAYTKFILKLVKNETVDAKADAPEIDKKVSNTTSDDYKDAAVASVGSKVNFQLTSNVPPMDGYDKYFFIVEDTLSGGLTLDENSVAITLDGAPLTKDTHYTVTATKTAEGQPTILKIVFKNFIQYKENVSAPIVITYSATVNKFAVVGDDPNTNSAKLTYSNDPNYDYAGENEPSGLDPVGVTPSTISAVYVTAIQINKVNSDEYPLTGAEFTITGDGVITTGVTTINGFDLDNEHGTYYKLKNGSYTTTAPNAENSSLYVSTTIKYSPAAPTTAWTTKGVGVDVKGEVGLDGVLKFEGLGAGTYTIKETKAPENYNKINEDIIVTITCTPPETITTGDEACTWTATYQIGTTGSPITVKVQDGIIPLDIENRSGAELPSTGGIGTTIFVYGGIILMVLALGVVAVRTYSRKKNA